MSALFSVGSDCSGECTDCGIHYIGGCIAGHGDDDFSPINKYQAKEYIKKGWVKEGLLVELKNKFKL